MVNERAHDPFSFHVSGPSEPDVSAEGELTSEEAQALLQEGEDSGPAEESEADEAQENEEPTAEETAPEAEQAARKTRRGRRARSADKTAAELLAELDAAREASE